MREGVGVVCAANWPHARLMRIECRAVAMTPLRFLEGEEGYKGNGLHSRFEVALLRTSEDAYRTLSELSAGSVKPYMLVPPLDVRVRAGRPFRETTYAAGREFEFSLTLAGPALRHVEACSAALRLAAQTSTRTLSGEFELRNVAATTLPTALLGHVELRDRQTLSFESMVRVFGATRRVPDFRSLAHSLLRRVERIPLTDAAGNPLSLQGTARLLQQAASVRIATQSLRWYDWPRYSPREDAWMRYGGWLGEITYEGDIGPFVPLLRLGEWLHVGGKSVFGLGRYRMIEPNRGDSASAIKQEDQHGGNA